MKGNQYLLQAVALAATANLSSANNLYRYYPETPESHTVLDHAGISWKIESQTILNEDTGEQRLRLTHKLVAPILATDEITFTVQFYAQSAPPVLSSEVIGEDQLGCTLAISKEDSRFWVQTVTDGAKKCDETADVPYNTTGFCENPANTYNTENGTLESSENSHWLVSFEDNDPENRFCEEVSTTEWSPYKCKSIMCVMERLLDTKDTENDFIFKPDGNTAPDKMIIRPNRAWLQINKSTFDKMILKGPHLTNIVIPVYAGAMMTTLASVAVASVAMLAF